MAGFSQQQRQVALTPVPRSVEMAPGDAPDEGVSLRSVTQLIQAGRSLLDQPQGACQSLAHVLAAITRNRAQLIFSTYDAGDAGSEQLAPMECIFASLPLRFGTHAYATLHVAADAARPDTPALPLAEAHLLADVCGLLLHDVEQSALVNARTAQLGERPAPEPLTVREREILTLICLGCSDADIAEKLSIASGTVDKHRQHIYAKLGVHTERAARLVAYRERLVSLLT